MSARADSLFTDEELERQAHPPGSRLASGGMQQQLNSPAVGFESVARREHAIERNALAALHHQEEEERKQMLVSSPCRRRSCCPLHP